MSLTSTRQYLALLVLSLALAGCGRAAPASSSPTPQPDAVLTAAAQTAEARLTAQSQPTATPTQSPVPISAPTTSAPAEVLTATLPVGFTPTAPPGGSAGGDLAVYFADITIPDGTDLKPGESFTKTWRLSNAGTSTWTTNYALAFIGGAQMGAPAAVPLTKQVAPGEMVDISVNLVAPLEGGNHRGFWEMRNASGQLFATAIFVEIDVVGGSPGPTSTHSPGGNARVTEASLSVDEASPDECPHVFTFTGSLTLNKPTTVTYLLEAGTSTPGFTFNLPGAFTRSFKAGSHQVVYNLQIGDTVDAWAVLKISAPNTVESNQVSFSLNCSP
ncbi:MAG TPA: NBR1-Ig-like domain-containing protein [Anaerolineales bacterium]|nr:NBR1-Ig-like domain-containing protein [Anaerolineales bacterium]